MRSKSLLIASLLLAQGLSFSAVAELGTLFSTPQERQLINANRYNTAKANPESKKPAKPEPVMQIVRKEVVKEFRINGITVSDQGPHSVWVNERMYLDGEQLEGSSRVKVLPGKDIKVRITAPDGKQYFGTSGESLEVKYLETTDL